MSAPRRPATPGTEAVRLARDVLLAHSGEPTAPGFAWPRLATFNFALEWFDVVAGEHPDRAAVTIVADDHSVRSWSYGQLSADSDRVATWLRSQGVGRGDRVLVMLGNTIELWQSMLALSKLGAVAVPTSLLLSADELAERMRRTAARAIIAPFLLADRLAPLDGGILRIGAGPDGDRPDGWARFADARLAADGFEPDGETRADDPCLLYFTSGTTSRPKLVRHSHVSYPVGHLSTMWWLGLRPGDVHLNISSPGWGKHAWSSFYAPFLAESTVFVYDYARFDAARLLEIMDAHRVTTFCAPPTVWRMLIQADLGRLQRPPRELLGAGEPLNPEVIQQVRRAWGRSIRDGYGQTEMTASIGNAPGLEVRDGSMGRPLPGYPIVLLDQETGMPGARVGEIAVDLSAGSLGLMPCYDDDDEATARAFADGYYRTGDIASVDDDGYISYVGRGDDVFKASDYKISPFELESVLVEHPAVVEAAVVPSPEALRLAVPKAFVRLTAQAAADPARAAADIFRHARARLSAFQRIRILEFVADLPKTISGKIRRVELRAREDERVRVGDDAGQFLERDYR